MRLSGLILFMLLPLTASADPKSHVDDVNAWHKDRLAHLQEEGGWLSLVGLSWLQEGDNKAGSDETATIKFPATAPRVIGSFTRAGDHLTFTAAKDVPVTVDGKPVEKIDAVSDEKGAPTT